MICIYSLIRCDDVVNVSYRITPPQQQQQQEDEEEEGKEKEFENQYNWEIH